MNIISLTDENLHIWCLNLEELRPFSPAVIKSLAADELVRSGNFRFEKDRNNFMLRRGLLRALIGNYLNIEANNIKFYYGESGKPEIVNNEGKVQLYFNMAKAEDLVIYAFSGDREVGIDIESIRPIPEMAQLVENWFSDREKAVFNSLAESPQIDFFFRIWARKEAYLKATGQGIGLLTKNIDVFSTDHFLQISDNPHIPGSWRIEDLCLVPGFSAAYAAEGAAPSKCVLFGRQGVAEIFRPPASVRRPDGNGPES